uniref:Immediate early response 3 interacting protein 1 n=1 Tax=Ovis aries TaxID=9940 RepID=A0AC11CWW2_SHEEP
MPSPCFTRSVSSRTIFLGTLWRTDQKCRRVDVESTISNRASRYFGWGTDQGIGGFGEEPGIKSQLMNLIRSVRTVMRVPLIIVNSIAIVLLLLFG